MGGWRYFWVVAARLSLFDFPERRNWKRNTEAVIKAKSWYVTYWANQMAEKDGNQLLHHEIQDITNFELHFRSLGCLSIARKARHFWWGNRHIPCGPFFPRHTCQDYFRYSTSQRPVYSGLRMGQPRPCHVRASKSYRRSECWSKVKHDDVLNHTNSKLV